MSQSVASTATSQLSASRDVVPFRARLPRVALTMFRFATVCLALYWILIFIGTHLPKAAMPAISYSDKLAHAGAFSGLTFLLGWAIRAKSRRKHALIVASIALVYGCGDELTQNFIPGRACELGDMLADAIGVAIGLTAYTVARWALSRITIGQKLIARLAG